MKPTTLITGLFIAFILVSCTSKTRIIPEATAITLPTSTTTQSPTGNILSQRTPTPTRIPLPYITSNFDDQYCNGSPDAFLLYSDARNISDDEVARKLMEVWLSYFNSPQTPDYCRIDGYKIEMVYHDERTPYSFLKPQGDIMRQIMFSVKLVQLPNFWISWWTGDIDQQNWFHTGNYIAIFRSNEKYTMKFASP